MITARLSTIQIVGDDLGTNPDRIRRAIESKAVNAALTKLDQSGTLSGTLEAMRLAGSVDFATVVSARPGETEDTRCRRSSG